MRGLMVLSGLSVTLESRVFLLGRLWIGDYIGPTMTTDFGYWSFERLQ